MLYGWFLTAAIMRLVYGKNWESQPDTLKPWIVPLVTVTSFIWFFVLIILPADPQWFVIGYCLLYPIVIAVWAVYERTKPR